jgi:3-methylcrotonyl-CoA carboxylase alpha subunit
MKRNLRLNQVDMSIEVKDLRPGQVAFRWQEQDYSFELVQRQGDWAIMRDGHGQLVRLTLTSLSEQILISGQGVDALIGEKQAEGVKKAQGFGGLNAPMPGKIFKILVPEGQKVAIGQTILIMEAMKMEHAIKADKEGVVSRIYFKEGEQVQSGAALAEIKA